LKSRYSIIGIAMVMMLMLVAVVPAFAKVAGVVTTTKSYVEPGGVFGIELADGDVNVVNATTWADTAAPVFTLGGVNFITLPGLTGATDTLSGVPTISTVTGDTTSGTASTAATYTDITNFQVEVFNAGTGVVKVTSLIAFPNRATITFDYNIADVNVTNAKVTSASDTTGISVSLTETGADTGIFRGSVYIDAAASDDAQDKILAAAGSTITIKYTDASPAGTRTGTIQVESTAPQGALVSPADGNYTTSAKPEVTLNFTDLDSTVKEGTITIAVDDATKTGDSAATVVVGTVTTTAITNGWKAVATLDASTDAVDQHVWIEWSGQAFDIAGNTGNTDADAATGGDQSYKIVIDKAAPAFANTATKVGVWYDAENKKVVTNATESKDTSIGIKFDNVLTDLKEKINGGTVTGADFEVDKIKLTDGTTSSDITPSAAIVPTCDKACNNWIILTVPAMAPDSTATVIHKISAGGVTDTAGNTTAAEVTLPVATDAQSPSISYSLNRTLGKDDVTVTVTTNESGSVPTVTVNGTAQSNVKLDTTNVYTSKITKDIGVYSIQLSLSDSASNTVTLGNVITTTDWPTSKSIAFQIDDAIPEPAYTVGSDTSSPYSNEQADPFFLKLDFTGEGTEYGLKLSKTTGHTLDGLLVVPLGTYSGDQDTYNTVTVTKFHLKQGDADYADVLSKVETNDNIAFTVPIAGMTIGDHKLKYSAEDTQGNKITDKEIKFTVKARSKYSVPLSAGWNLVSLPGDPIDSAIDSVLPADHPATSVLTFKGGEWHAATRVAGGTWEGSLTTIDSSAAYWINSSSGTPIKTLLALPNTGAAIAPTTVPITKGWNMIPIIDLAQSTAGSQVSSSAKDYLTSVNWSVAYQYTASTRAWTRIVPTAGVVVTGSGYWLWAEAAGTLVP